MSDQTTHDRFRAFSSPDGLADTTFVIVGCGNIGSWLAIALAKLGATRFVLWDDDTVELVNIGTQYYTPGDVGEHKTMALARHIRQHNPQAMVLMDSRRFEADDYSLPDMQHVLCATTDDLKSRLTCAKAAQDNPLTMLLVDLRMGMFHGEFRYVLRDQLDAHIAEFDTLPGDDQIRPEPCGAASVGSTGMYMAGLAAPWLVHYAQWHDLEPSQIPSKMLANPMAGQFVPYGYPTAGPIVRWQQ